MEKVIFAIDWQPDLSCKISTANERYSYLNISRKIRSMRELKEAMDIISRKVNGTGGYVLYQHIWRGGIIT